MFTFTLDHPGKVQMCPALALNKTVCLFLLLIDWFPALLSQRHTVRTHKCTLTGAHEHITPDKGHYTRLFYIVVMVTFISQESWAHEWFSPPVTFAILSKKKKTHTHTHTFKRTTMRETQKERLKNLNEKKRRQLKETDEDDKGHGWLWQHSSSAASCWQRGQRDPSHASGVIISIADSDIYCVTLICC